MEQEIHNIESGSGVYDSTGHEVGTVVFVFRQLSLPDGGTDPNATLTSEDMVEVRTTGFLGLGAYIHIHLRDIQSVTSNTLLLTKSFAELQQMEQHDLPVSRNGPH
jgi:hypothetical protein